MNKSSTKSSMILRGIVVACALGSAALPSLAAQTQAKQSGPARWNTGDSTKQQRMATLKKEINAAYAQQQSDCRKQAASRRSSCLKEARQTYDRDMKNAPQLLADAPKGEVTERVVSTSPATPDTPMQPGANAYGNSAAGSTGAGSPPSSGAMGSSGNAGNTGSGTATVEGKDDAMPTTNGQTGGLPPPQEQNSAVPPTQQPTGTPPIQQQ